VSTVFLPSPNRASRNGTRIDHLVVHWMSGTLAGTDATFRNPDSQVSAHYAVEGTVIHQYVNDKETAWHAGDRAENQRSIGIEHSAAPGRAATQATIDTSVALMTRLCLKYDISPDHIYPHKRFTATQCPGTLPVAAMVARVRANLALKPAPPPPEPVPVPEESFMADLTLTNPLTKDSASATTGLNSVWFYSVASYGLLKEMAAKTGVTVDESAIVSGVVESLAGPLTAAITAVVSVGGSPDEVAAAVVQRLRDMFTTVTP